MDDSQTCCGGAYSGRRPLHHFELEVLSNHIARRVSESCDEMNQSRLSPHTTDDVPSAIERCNRTLNNITAAKSTMNKMKVAKSTMKDVTMKDVDIQNIEASTRASQLVVCDALLHFLYCSGVLFRIVRKQKLGISAARAGAASGAGSAACSDSVVKLDVGVIFHNMCCRIYHTVMQLACIDEKNEILTLKYADCQCCIGCKCDGSSDMDVSMPVFEGMMQVSQMDVSDEP